MNKYIDSFGYVMVCLPNGCKKREHRLVWEQHFGPLPNGYVVHHLNHDRQDNRIENLQALPRGIHQAIHSQEIREGLQRMGTEAMSRIHRGERKRSHRRGQPCTSRFKGVHLHMETGKWIARITLAPGVRRYLGLFLSEIEAAQAYDKAAFEVFKSDARLNFETKEKS